MSAPGAGIPAVLGHYRIVDKVGEGGMGEVYRAHDDQLDRDVGIKVLPPGTLNDPTARPRLIREARTASALKHPNICTIYEVGEDAGQIYIAMELVDGRSLNTIIPAGGLANETTIRYGTHIAAALEHAHSRRVIHRDLKSSNVIVTPDGRPVVLDFGLARRLPEPEAATIPDTSLTQGGQVVGTVQYMAPEVLRGHTADAGSDIWSLGILLSEMASGHLPFKGSTSFELSSAILHDAPAPLPPHVSLGLRAVIERCLAKDPSQRYQRADEVCAALDVASSAIAILPRRTAPSKKLLFAGGGAILVFVALMLLLNAARVREWRFGRQVMPQAGSASVLPLLSEGKHVAVLPFRVLGERTSLGYVGEGISEALTAKLFQFPAVHVTVAPSTKDAEPEQAADKIARGLGANLLVSGTIQGSGENIRVVAYLEQLGSGRRIWTSEFTTTAQELFALEDDLSAKIIAALELNPTHDRRGSGSEHPTENIAAYDLYLRGREVIRSTPDKKGIETALRLYEQALKEDPRFALAYAAIANGSLEMYQQTRDPFWAQKALTAAKQAQQLDDSASEVHAATGGVYLGTGKPAEAVEQFNRAIELAPNSDAYYVNLADAYLSLGKKAEGIAAYQKAIQISPYYWRNHNYLGAAYASLGEYDKAAAAFSRVIELAPDQDRGYANLGGVYFMMGKITESIPMFQKAISIAPKGKNYSNLATAYLYLRRYGDSVPVLEKAVAMDPNNHIIMGNLADAYRWNNQREKSMAAYDRAVALAYKELQVNPREPDATRYLALYYSKKGDVSKSMEWLERSRSFDPEGPKFLSAAAVVYALANRQDEALKQLRAALQKGYSVEEARSEPELKNLESRPEFAKLLTEFAAKKK
jgi:eukaryotic-like serine/threonine-protein kinase